MQKNEFDFVTYPLNQDMSKQWFVKYPNPNGGGKLKKYGRLNEIQDQTQRILESKKMIFELKKTHHVLDFKCGTLHRKIAEIVDERSFGKKPKTATAYENKAKIFLEWFNQSKEKELSPQSGSQFLRWVFNRKTVNSNTTVNCYRRDMKSFFTDLVKQGFISFNPFEHTRKLPEHTKTNTWYREHEQKILKKEISERDPQLWLCCMIQFYCFIRPGDELATLKIGSIDKTTEQWRFKIEGDDAKVNHYRYVPIPSLLLKILIPYIGNYPSHYFLIGHGRCPSARKIGRNSLYNRHRIYLKAFGLEDGHTFYSWKNTGAVMMYKHGIKLKYISMLMGHSGIEITDEYFKSLGIDDVLDEIIHHYPEV